MNSPIETQLPTATASDHSDAGTPDSLRDLSLVELQTSRNLQKVVSSVERFLLNQIDRLETALQESQKISDQGATVQRLLMGFEDQKQDWKQQQQTELQQLDTANEKLIQGWKSLEDERRRWLVEREVASPTTSKKSQPENTTTVVQPTVQTPVPDALSEEAQWEQMQRETQQHSRNRR